MNQQNLQRKIQNIIIQFYKTKKKPTLEKLNKNDLILIINNILYYNSSLFTILNQTEKKSLKEIKNYTTLIENIIFFLVNQQIETFIYPAFDKNIVKNLHFTKKELIFKNFKTLFYYPLLLKNQQILQKYVRNFFKNNYKEFLNSIYWNVISEEKKRQADYSCQLCGSQNQLNTHHSDYTYYGIEIFNMDKLIVLCKKCHSKFHNKGVK